MKNYYEILEVDKNASPEIIEKAYKILVKKYHPDLQQSQTDKKFAEEQIKLINDAYDTLSDKDKKENYDINLKNNNISEDDYNLLINENLQLKKELNALKRKFNNSNNYNEQYTNTQQYTNTNRKNNNSYSNNKDNFQSKENYYYNTNNTKEDTVIKPTLMDYIRYYTKFFAIKLLKLIGCIAIIGIMIFLLLQFPFFNQLFTKNNYILLIIIVVGLIYLYSNKH